MQEFERQKEKAFFSVLVLNVTPPQLYLITCRHNLNRSVGHAERTF